MRIIIAAMLLVLGGTASAQQAPPAYGLPIALAEARWVVDAAIADGERQNLQLAVAVVDWAGNLAAFARSDNTQTASIAIAIAKVRTATASRRPSKSFEDALVGGRMALLAIDGLLPIEGGVLILRDGRIVGAVGVSGGTAAQDGVVAATGLAAQR